MTRGRARASWGWALLLTIALSACELFLTPSSDLLRSSTDAASGDSRAADAEGPHHDSDSPRTYVEEVLFDSPLAYWRFDEPAGTTIAKDSSPNGNDATYVGGVTRGERGAIANDSDTAARFTGTGYVDAGFVFSFAGLSQFSVEMWTLATPSPRFLTMASRTDGDGTSNSTGYLMGETPDGGSFFAQRYDLLHDAATWAASTTVPSPRQFTHVVMTFDGANLWLYVNGNVSAMTPGAFRIDVPADDFVIGAQNGGTGSLFVGVLDDVAVYDHALCAVRVRAHFLVGSGVATAGLGADASSSVGCGSM